MKTPINCSDDNVESTETDSMNARPRAPRHRPWGKGKHILVTGASSGIGREVCHRLVGVADRLTLVSRNSSGKLEAVAASLREEARAAGAIETRIVAATLDLRDTAGMRELVRGVYEHEQSQIDAFINCAGGSHIYGPLDSMEHADIDHIFDINAKAPLHWLRELLPRMKDNKLSHEDLKRGHVLMLSSRSGERALANLSAYAAAKGAIEKMIEGVRTEYARYRIAFTLINPGSINTAFTDPWPLQPRDSHNQESMSTEESIVPILMALHAQYATNKVSYESLQQWTGEPGMMKAES